MLITFGAVTCMTEGFRKANRYWYKASEENLYRKLSVFIFSSMLQKVVCCQFFILVTRQKSLYDKSSIKTHSFKTFYCFPFFWCDIYWLRHFSAVCGRICPLNWSETLFGELRRAREVGFPWRSEDLYLKLSLQQIVAQCSRSQPTKREPTKIRV